MSLAFDETGRPYIILREQAKKKRIKGIEAHKVCKTSIEFVLTFLCIIDKHFSRSYRRKSFKDISWTKGYG